MIAVIADDLSGATEVAGVAFQQGLTAEVHVGRYGSSVADVVVVDTNTRCCQPAEAARRVAHVTNGVLANQPDWVFKKVDSVLRGPVLAELESMLNVADWCRVLLVPANPSRGRVIRRGEYWIGNVPLKDTALASDLEHATRSSSVVELLGGGTTAAVCSVSHARPLPAGTVAIADACRPEDLDYWAKQLDWQTLPAGAAEFFDAVLSATRHASRYAGNSHAAGALSPTPTAHEAESLSLGRPVAEPSLFVCGSATAWQTARHQQCVARGVPIAAMPSGLCDPTSSETLLDRWADAAIDAIDARGTAMVAIGQPVARVSCPPLALVGRLSQVVTRVVRRRRLGRLLVEGGATASALVGALACSRLSVVGCHGPGIVAVAARGGPPPIFIIKPGSYDWPESIWQQLVGD